MICFVGNIGVGKSTLVRLVSDALGLTAHLEEPDENPFLPSFYAGQSTAFLSQLFFLDYLSERALREKNPERPVLIERCIHDNLWVFSKLQLEEGRITPHEWQLFLSLYQKLRLITPEPQRYLYCRCPPEVAAQRVRARGRSYEKEIPLGYLQAIDRLYEAWVATLPPTHVVRIDTTHLDKAMLQAQAAAAEVLDPLHLAQVRGL